MELLKPDFTPPGPKAVAEFKVTILSNGQAHVNGPLDNAALCMTACQAIIQTSLDAQMRQKQGGLVLPVGPVPPIRNKDFRNGQ